MDQLPRLGKKELICLLSFTCNYVVFVWRDFPFLWVLGMGYVILLWHSLSLPYNYFGLKHRHCSNLSILHSTTFLISTLVFCLYLKYRLRKIYIFLNFIIRTLSNTTQNLIMITVYVSIGFNATNLPL